MRHLNGGMRGLVWWGYFLFMTAMLMVPNEFLPVWLQGGGAALDGIVPKDKVLHGFSFMCLMLVSAWARGSWGSWPMTEGLWIFIYAMMTEVAQGLTGWRDAEWMDLVADFVGMVIGGIVVRATSLPARARDQ